MDFTDTDPSEASPTTDKLVERDTDAFTLIAAANIDLLVTVKSEPP